MPRFYVEGCQDAQTGITIMGEDVNHIKNVLRLTIGDTITVCDGAGKEYECEIAEISKEQVYANIVDINQNAAELPCNITLFQGMPKSDKNGIYHPEGGRTWSSRDCSGYDETDCRET